MAAVAARPKALTLVGLTLLLLAALTLRAQPAHPASARADSAKDNQMWFWSKALVIQSLYKNGLDWSNADHDTIAGAKCVGLGHWIYSQGVPMFRDFHCYVDPTKGSTYKIIFHVASRRTYRYEFANYQSKQTWWWPPQYAADTLVKQGIRWSSGFDAINQATCSAFGPSSRIDGALYWKLYYCSVRPTRGYAYAVVMDVTDKSSASIRFVTYTDELPVTPTVTNPTPSSNTTNKAIVDQLLLNQITNQMLRDGIKRQNQITWGNDSAPSAADFWTGAVGCKSDPFDTSLYKSYSAC